MAPRAKVRTRGADPASPNVGQTHGGPPLGGLDAGLRALALVGVWAGLLTPAIYAQVTWFAFTTLKVFWLQGWVGLSLPAYVILACRRAEYRPPANLVMWALLLRMVSLALSTITSGAPYLAWWGSLERMDGLWSMLHFAAWAVMAAGVARSWRDWRRLLHIEILVGLIAGCVVILQVPFPAILGQAGDVRLSGLFGNPIYSAAFHSLIIFLVAFVWTTERTLTRAAKATHIAAVAVSIPAIVLAGSRGALLGLACGAAFSILVFGFLSRRRKTVLLAVLAIAAVATLYLVFAIVIAPRLDLFWTRHENLRHLFLLKDDSGRLGYWRLALDGIREHPLLGWGNGNFESLFDHHYIPLQGCTETGADDAHNIVLHVLATTGALGLVAYFFLWFAVGRAILRAQASGKLDKVPAAVLVGLPVVQFVQLLFNPDSPGTLFVCYLVFALAAWLFHPAPSELPQPRSQPGVFAFALAEVAAIVLVVAGSVLPVCASKYVLFAVTEYKQHRPQESWHWARKAASVPTPYLEDQLLVDLQLLLSLADRRTLEGLPAWRELFAMNRTLVERHLGHQEQLIIRLTYARMLCELGMATDDPSLKEEGERRLRELLLKNPQRQSVLFALGAILAGSGRLDEAERAYRKAFDEEPRCGESHFRLGRFLWHYRRRYSRGTSLIAEGTRSLFPYVGTSLEEVAITAAAFDAHDDVQGLSLVVPMIDLLRPTQAAAPYLTLALSLERAGMLNERDHILRLGLQYAPELEERASAFLQGKTATLAEAERMRVEATSR